MNRQKKGIQNIQSLGRRNASGVEESETDEISGQFTDGFNKSKHIQVLLPYRLPLFMKNILVSSEVSNLTSSGT